MITRQKRCIGVNAMPENFFESAIAKILSEIQEEFI